MVLALAWLLGSIEKSLALSTWHLPLRYLCSLTRSPISLLRNKRAQLLLIISEMLQTPSHLCVLCWTLCSTSLCFLYRGAPELNTVLQMWANRGAGSPVGHILPNASQDLIGPPHHEGTLSAHGQPVIHQDFQKCCIKSKKLCGQKHWQLKTFPDH